MRRVWVSSLAYEAAVATVVAARTEAGISQRELAQRLGKPRSFVSKIESRERRLDMVEFIVLARAIGLSPSALIAVIESSLPGRVDI